MVFLGPGLAANMAKFLMYHLFRSATRIVPRLPRWLQRILPMLFAPLAYIVAGRARRQATINILHVLGKDRQKTATGRRKVRRVVRGVFYHSIRNYLETFTLPTQTHQDILRRVYIGGVNYLEEALALGKGAIVFTAHYGPFDYHAQWFAANGYQVTIPVEKLADERMLRLMLDLRRSGGVNFLPLGGTSPLRAIMQALRKNQIVLITTDRAVEGESVIMNFFDAPARLPIGPANLSIRTGAPLVGAFGWQTSTDHIVGEFIPLTLALPEDEQKQTALVEAAIIRQMERFITAHPEQWVVFEPIWIEKGKKTELPPLRQKRDS